MSYDSTNDTLAHIDRVRVLLSECTNNLSSRGADHDQSKLEEPEKSVFDRVTPRLKELTYGTPEYQEQLEDMGVALQHHYEHNSHHPQHYPNGVYDMSLLDLLEMLCDWKAATERMKDGDLHKSILQNEHRFKYDPQLTAFFLRTAEELGWIDP